MATGTSRYLVATLIELGVYKAVEFQISVDGRTESAEGMMLAIGNGPLRRWDVCLP